MITDRQREENRIRATARNKAMAELAKRHPDEYADLYDQYREAALPRQRPKRRRS